MSAPADSGVPRSDGWVQLGLLCLVTPLTQTVPVLFRAQLNQIAHDLQHLAQARPLWAETVFAGLHFGLILGTEVTLLVVALGWRAGSLWARQSVVQLSRDPRWRLVLRGLPYGVAAYFGGAGLLWWMDSLPVGYTGFVATPSPAYLPAAFLVGTIAAGGEELYFRGALLPLCHSLIGKGPAYAVNVVLFAAAHVHTYGNPTQLFVIAIVGWACCRLYYATGSLIPGIACHAIFNIAAHSLEVLFFAER